MEKIQRIVCPIDFSETSEIALRYAVELAQSLGATVDIVHVYQIPAYSLPDGAILLGPEIAADLSQKLQKELDLCLNRYASTGVVKKSHLVEGVTHHEIHALAEKVRSQLIVMGTHGRTGFAHALLGSTTEKVVRTSPIPVLTVRGKKN